MSNLNQLSHSLNPTLLQSEHPQFSQPFLIGQILQPSGHFCGSSVDILQYAHALLVLRTPEMDTALQAVSHQSRVEGPHHLADHASFDAVQEAAGLLDYKCTLPAYISFLSTCSPKSFYTESISVCSFPSLYWHWGLPWPRCQTLHFAFMNFVRFTEAHFWLGSFLSAMSIRKCESRSSMGTMRLGLLLVIAGLHLTEIHISFFAEPLVACAQKHRFTMWAQRITCEVPNSC